MDAIALIDRHWNLEVVDTAPLGSYEDENLAVRTADGMRRVLKREHRAAPSLALEHAILARLTDSQRVGVDLPAPLPTASGELAVDLGDGTMLRLLSWVSGTVMADLPDLDPAALRGLGALAAHVGDALADLPAPADLPDSKWDPRHAGAVVEGVLAEGAATAAEATALRAALALSPDAAAELPLRLVHGDITDHNTLAAPGRPAPSGLIDFGDLAVSWRIADLAAAAVAVACRTPHDPLPALLEVLAGYHDVAPLDRAEADALWPLVLARAAACAALSVRQRRRDPDSAYVRAMDAGDWAGLRGLLALPAGLGAAAIRHATGAATPTPESTEPAVPVLAGPPTRVLDLSVASPALDAGDWRDPGRLAPAGPALGPGLGRWGEIRLTAAGVPADDPPPTLHLGADLYAAAGTPVRAPRAGTVVAAGDDELSIGLDDPRPATHVRLAGVRPTVAAGAHVAAGDPVATIAPGDGPGPHVHVQYAPAPATPGLGDPRLRAAWLALCPDPSPLVGVEVRAPSPPDPEAERARRAAVLAGAQELYYRDPLITVRGWRQYLYDGDGRPYLDMVNNVASIGHSHPRVTAAAARQLRLLNTNSRFLYDSMTAYAERLAALLPEALDTVFLVNSGSEACDLALQIARAATGRRDVVAVQGAYHGWTGNVYDACTSPADNPRWRETKPPWVHLADQPDPYRGIHGADATGYLASVATACAAAAEAGDGPGAFIAESMLGNQGAVELPAGYLAGAYAAVRAAGGVCIADEIQVGYARTGETFWAFAHEGVVPDVVATAKATGNGHPIGAVVCRRELADALGDRAAFFSSTGGGPVSCEIGIAVLDVIADERLQDNARTVGALLKRELRRLAETHEAIGAVHGRGLYLGVDLVVDRGTQAPDRPRALAVSERLRRLGIVMQPTGDAGNVLKVKPPLCLTAADAQRFVARLDRALGDVAARD